MMSNLWYYRKYVKGIQCMSEKARRTRSSHRNDSWAAAKTYDPRGIHGCILAPAEVTRFQGQNDSIATQV